MAYFKGKGGMMSGGRKGKGGRGEDGDDLIGCCEIRTVSAQSCHVHMCSNAAVDGNLHWSSR